MVVIGRLALTPLKSDFSLTSIVLVTPLRSSPVVATTSPENFRLEVGVHVGPTLPKRGRVLRCAPVFLITFIRQSLRNV